jgi:hypothetical protein
MPSGDCVCGWKRDSNPHSTSRSAVAHMRTCSRRKEMAQERRDNPKRRISEAGLGESEDNLVEHPQKNPRLSQVGVGVEGLAAF